MATTIRNLDRSTFPQVCVSWADEQQWNPGKSDVDTFPLADPNGMFAGYVDGEAVSCVTAMKYEKNVGFVGYYIVHNASDRGKGYGLQIFKNAMAYLGPDCNMGLDGVVEQQKNYERSGFKKVWDNIRFHGSRPQAEFSVPSLPSTLAALELTNAVSDATIAAVQEYESIYSGCKRPLDFFRAWLNHPVISTVLIVDATAAGGPTSAAQIKGFGSIRPATTGFRIGPLYATSPEVASVISAMLANKATAGQAVFADVCMANTAAPKVFEGVGLSGVGGFVTGRMWSKGRPIEEDAVKGVFGVMTLEIG
ncbi:hypothetical protein HDU96_001807 [Phlyctochytrium bullatum]|nr:hypothetical protein HDU96_001807 [Phlyctochytrium bullatum]